MVNWWIQISVRENRKWIIQRHSQHLAQGTEWRKTKRGKLNSWVTWTSQKKWHEGESMCSRPVSSFCFFQISSLVLKWQRWLYLGLIIVQLHINCFASTSYVCVGFFTWQEIKQFKFHGNMSRYYQPRYSIASDIRFVRGFYVLIY